MREQEVIEIFDNFLAQELEISFQDEVCLETEVDIIYIKTGEEEIKFYVNSVAKPDIDEFSEGKKSEIDDFVEGKKSEIEDFVEVEKVEIGEFSASEKQGLEEFAVEVIKPELGEYLNQAEGLANNAKQSENLAIISATNALEQADRAELQANRALEFANSVDPSVLLNTEMITNCILEAPNGVVTNPSDKTLTIKAGVKLLIPDGRTSKGMLKNKTYTVPQDINRTFTDQTITTPTFIVFNPDVYPYIEIDNVSLGADNYMRWSNGSFYGGVVVGKAGLVGGNVSGLFSYSPIKLFHQADINSILNACSPNYDRMYAISTGYTAPCKGSVIVFGLIKLNEYLQLKINGVIVINNACRTNTAADDFDIIPVASGDVIGSNCTLRFVPDYGVRL